jgi:diaminopimelate epimerase
MASGEGLGNSFLIYRFQSESQLAQLQASAAVLCKSDYDGLLIVGDAGDADCAELVFAPDVPMSARVINRDGGDGGTCLNGLRVVALLSGQESGVLRMAGREIPWQRMMMPAIFDPTAPPAGELIELHLAAQHLSPSLWQPRAMSVAGNSAWAVDFWNPHCVIEVETPADADLSTLAAEARRRVDLFPAGVNVEVVHFGDGTVQMRVDERGVGETQACGSGAVAVAVAAWSSDRIAQDQEIDVQMPGGNLSICPTSQRGILLVGAATISRFDEF